MFREGFVHLSAAKESKKERRVASLAVVQESGYDENVLDSTILSKLPPHNVEGVARTIIDIFRRQHSGISRTGTNWQLKVTKKFLKDKLLFHPVSCFSSQRPGLEEGRMGISQI